MHAFFKASFPNTARAACETVWLPQPMLFDSEEEMRQVVEAIKKMQRQARALV